MIIGLSYLLGSATNIFESCHILSILIILSAMKDEKKIDSVVKKLIILGQ